MFRRIAKISWKDRVTNEEVLHKLGVKKELLTKTKTHKLSYFGHVTRHENIQKTILTGRIEGKRGRGRPRRQWGDDVKEWTGMQLSECMSLAKDREAWRVMARRPRGCTDQPRSARRDDT